MRIYTRYRGRRSPAKGRDRWSWFFGLLCLALLTLIGWILWESREIEPGPRPARRTNELAGARPPEPTHPVVPSLAATSAAPTRVPAPLTSAVVAAGGPAAANVAPPARTNAVRLVATNEFQDEPPGSARRVRNVFEAQLAMAREVISCGPLDGSLGSQTRAALSAWQRQHGLVPTGALDGDTRALLRITPPLFTTFTVSADDLARLMPVPRSWLGKSEQPRLDYETILELVAEKSHAHPNLIRALNPDVNWDAVVPGTVVKVPRVEYPPPRARAAVVRISLSNKTLEAFDAASNLLAHFPCSIARHVEKRPVGELRVAVTAPNPNYTFHPEIFPESEEGRRLGRKLVLPPGPNNPVGVAWIGLDRPGYGIHGTPAPEQVGRTESHGCFRLANWNAEYLLRLVTVGTPVVVEP